VKIHEARHPIYKKWKMGEGFRVELEREKWKGRGVA